MLNKLNLTSNFLLLLVILTNLLSSSNKVNSTSLNTIDFCKHDTNKVLLPCINKHKIACETKSICSIDTKQCELFDTLSKLVDNKNRMKKVKVFDTHIQFRHKSFEKRSKQEFHKFKENIPICEIDLNKVCQNSGHCFETSKLIFDEKTINIQKKRVACKCQNDYEYNCNSNYCSNDLISCELINKLNTTNFNIQQCNNSHNYTLDVLEKSMLRILGRRNQHYIDNSQLICENSHECILNKSVVFQGQIHSNELKRVDCKCQGNYRYKCNRNYCAIDSDSCEFIHQLINNIKQCDNKKTYTIIYPISIEFF
jgi:hypothetical protein